MDLRHLRSLVTVSEEGSLGKAATALHITQPALSRQMRELETALHTELLVRGPKGVELTPAGAVCRGRAAELINALIGAVERARQIARGERGRVGLGLSRSMWAPTLRAVDRIRQLQPDIEVQLLEIEPGPLMNQSLRLGEMEMAIAPEPPPSARPELEWEYLFDNPIDCVLLPADHPLAQRPRVTAADLQGWPMLWVPPNNHPPLTRALMSALRGLGIGPTVETVYAGVYSIITHVAAGRGWSPMPHLLVRHSPPNTVAVPLEGLNVPNTTVMVWRRGSDTPLLTRLRGLLVDLLGDQPRAVPRRGRGRGKMALPATSEPANPSAIEWRHLKAIVAVGGAGSVTRGAVQLGVTQPALSRQLRELERAIGAALLTRGTRGVLPTQAGAAFAADARAALEAADRLIAETSRVGRGTQGRCVIGTVPTAGAVALLNEVQKACAKRHPSLEVSVEDIPSVQQPRALLDGAIDIGLSILHVTPFDTDMVEYEMLVDDPLNSALVAVNHPLAAHVTLTASLLGDVPLLFMSRSFQPHFFDQVMLEFAHLGLRPRLTTAFEGLQTVWRHAAAGRGWALGFNSHLANPPTGLVARRIEGFAIPSGLIVKWRRNETVAAVHTVLSEFRLARAALKR